jgi:hypothetical protein
LNRTRRHLNHRPAPGHITERGPWARIILLVPLCGLLTACGAPASKRTAESEQCYRHGPMRTCTTVPPATSAQLAAVHRLSAPPPGRGRLLIVRNDWMDAYGHASVRLDGEPLLDTIPCSVLGVDVQPGTHQLQVEPASAATPRPVDIASGQLQVWRLQRSGTGLRARGFVLTPVEPADARALVQDCRVLALLDRTAPGAPSSR